MAFAHGDDGWLDDATLGWQYVSLRGSWIGMVMLLRVWDCDWVFVLTLAAGHDGDEEEDLGVCGCCDID